MNTNKFHPWYFKFASGQLNKSALTWDRTASIMTWVSNGYCIVKVTNLVVWTCEFVKIISRIYSVTSSNDFFHSVAFSCSKRFRYSVQNLTKFKFILRGSLAKLLQVLTVFGPSWSVIRLKGYFIQQDFHTLGAPKARLKLIEILQT